MAPFSYSPYWLRNYLRHHPESDRSVDNLTELCKRGRVKRILIDAKNLLYSFQYNWLALDVADADAALRRFTGNFPNVELIFAFHSAGPNDLEFTGVKSHDEKLMLGLRNMQTIRALRDGKVQRNTNVPAPLFFTEWLITRVQASGHRALVVEGWADHWQQLAIMAKEFDCDFVLATSQDFLLFDMGAACYLNSREPYGDGPTSFYSSEQVCEALGMPLQAVHELSCLMSNRIIQPGMLGEFHEAVAEANECRPQQVVHILAEMVRERWSDGKTHTLNESVAFVHELTGLNLKLVRRAMQFYQTDKKANVHPIAWPPLEPETRQFYGRHLRYRESNWFGETRVQAQFGDGVVRRDRLMQPLRELEYGLLSRDMNARQCHVAAVANGACDDGPVVIEHRMDFSDADDWLQFMVVAKLPKFAFGEHTDASELAADKSASEAFFDPRSVEHKHRMDFFLSMFGSNTRSVKGVPEGLIPAVAGLRYLLQLKIPDEEGEEREVDMPRAVDAFVRHLAILQHGNGENFARDFETNDDGHLDQTAYACFFLAHHALHAALELNSLCNFPVEEYLPLEKLWNYKVFASVFNRGADLTDAEAETARLLTDAVNTDLVREHIEVDLAPHGSIWVPSEHGVVPHWLCLPNHGKKCERRFHTFVPKEPGKHRASYRYVRDGGVCYQEGEPGAAPTKDTFGMAPALMHNDSSPASHRKKSPNFRKLEADQAAALAKQEEQPGAATALQNDDVRQVPVSLLSQIQPGAASPVHTPATSSSPSEKTLRPRPMGLGKTRAALFQHAQNGRQQQAQRLGASPTRFGSPSKVGSTFMDPVGFDQSKKALGVAQDEEDFYGRTGPSKADASASWRSGGGGGSKGESMGFSPQKSFDSPGKGRPSDADASMNWRGGGGASPQRPKVTVLSPTKFSATSSPFSSKARDEPGAATKPAGKSPFQSSIGGVSAAAGGGWRRGGGF